MGLAKNNSVKSFDALPADLKSRACFFTVGGEDTSISNAEYFLLPKIALQTAQSYLSSKRGNPEAKRNMLFVFDDAILYHFKEKHIFDLANQPFAPYNIFNEIMENTGVFLDQGYSMTSVVLVDKDSSSMMFKKDEQNVQLSLDSIADQVVDFSAERVSLTKGMMPLIEMKPDKTIIDYWQTPLLRHVKYQLQDLLGRLTESHAMHVLRKQMKMDEDPWDNYLIYDAKYFVPLLCHSSDIPVE